MSRELERNIRWGALLIILLVGWALALVRLGERSLWADEGQSAFLARSAGSEGILSALRVEYEKPLHLLVMIGAMRLGGSETILRIPSAIAAVLALAVTYVLGSRLMGHAAGMAGAFLLAVSRFAVGYAQEARTYALFELLACLSLLLLLLALTENRKRWWVGFALVTALLVYSHYFAWFVVGSEALFAGALVLRGTWVERRLDPRLLRLAASLLVVAVCYVPAVPWLFLSWRQAGAAGSATPVAGLKPFRLTFPFLRNLIGVFGPQVGGWRYNLFAGAFLLGLVSLAVQRKGWTLALLGLWFALPLLALPLLQGSRFFNHRYLIFFLPLFLLTIGASIAALATLLTRLPGASALRPLRPFLTLALAVVLFLPADLPALQEYQRWEKENWRNIGLFMGRNLLPGEAIYVSPRYWSFPLLYYQPSFRQRLVGGSAEQLAELERATAERPGFWFLRYSGPLGDPSGQLTDWVTAQGFDLLIAGSACGWGIDVYYRRFDDRPAAHQADLLRQAAEFCPTDPRFATAPSGN